MLDLEPELHLELELDLRPELFLEAEFGLEPELDLDEVLVEGHSR